MTKQPVPQPTPNRSPAPSSGSVALLLLLLLSGFFFFYYGERWLRAALLYLSQAEWARELVSLLPPAKNLAARFVAGEDIAAAIETSRILNGQGMMVTLDLLGEHTQNAADAFAARTQILDLLDEIYKQGVQANVSVKLSQLGVNIDPALALDNMRHLLKRAAEYNNRIRIDMEDSSLTDTTLRIYRTLRDEDDFNNVGVVIQSYLYRSDEDLRQLVTEGAWIRLCKGAYAEPPDIAYPHKADTDRKFIEHMQLLLSEEARRRGVYLGMATHDDRAIQATIDYARANNIPADSFEFQLLYGIRRELQEQLVADGYRVRVYVPYGTAWYPYFMRRLAERPANLWFFISNLAR
jgi:proline dehydrogenase